MTPRFSLPALELLSTLPTGVYVADDLGRGHFVNASFARAVGFEAHELGGEAWGRLVDPADRDAARDAWGVGVLRGEPFTDHRWLRHRDGRRIFVRLQLAPLEHPSHPRLWVITLEDLTASEESAARLRYFAEADTPVEERTGFGSWQYDPASGEILWSPELFVLFGMAAGSPPPDFLTHSRQIHPEDRASWLAGIERGMRGFPWQIEFRAVDAAGETLRWLRARGEPRLDASDRVVALTGTLLDITAEREAIEHTRVLAKLAERTSNAVVITDAERRIVWVNDGFTRITEYTLDEVRGRQPGQFLQGPETDPAVVEIMREAVREGRGFNVEIVNYGKSGRKYWLAIEVQPLRDETGRLTGFMAIELDVTERKNAEARLVELSERLVLAARAGGVGLWQLDLASGVLVWDDQMRHLYGRAEGVDGRSREEWLEAVHEADRARVDRMIDAAIEGSVSFDAEFRALWPDGTERMLKAFASVQRDAAGTPVRLLGTTWDITERIQVERDLVAAREEALEASRAKSTFLATMSHEIRTPMNGILGLTELALQGELAPDQREWLQLVHRSGEHLLEVINGILDLSRIEAGRVVLEQIPFDLNADAEDVIRLLTPRAAEKGISLVLRVVGERPPPMMGDALRVRQIVTNLVGNALKFTERGTVTLEIGRRGDFVRVTVADTGIGIPPDRLKSVFEPFMQADGSTTRKFGGTGLGLTISRQLAELMGGKLWVESAVGLGSAFHLELPLRPADAAPEVATPEEPKSGPARTHSGCVLIAEDNPVNVILARTLMSKRGWRVEVATDGAQALARALQGGIDLILMDVQMPELDGLEVTRRLRAAGQAMPIIALTANAMAGDDDMCLAAGCNAYLAKPFDAGRLYAITDRFAPV